MSIISEALKKAQEQSKGLRKEIPIPESVIKDAQPKRKNRFVKFFLLVLALTIPVLIVLDLTRETAKNSETPLEVMPPPSVMPTEEKAAEEPAKETLPHPYVTTADFSTGAASASQSFTLNGIFFDDESPYAVINDTVLEEGDWLGEARVISIEKNKVTLLSNGKEVTLILK